MDAVVGRQLLATDRNALWHAMPCLYDCSDSISSYQDCKTQVRLFTYKECREIMGSRTGRADDSRLYGNILEFHVCTFLLFARQWLLVFGVTKEIVESPSGANSRRRLYDTTTTND